MQFIRIDYEPQDELFLALLVTQEYSEDGDLDEQQEILYPGKDLGMAISFGVDNATNLGLGLEFTRWCRCLSFEKKWDEFLPS